MALIDKPQFNMYSPLINMYANRQYVNNMSDEEKSKSHFDDDLFQGKLKDVTFSKGEALGLGTGLLGSVGQYRLDKRDYNNQLDRINKYKSNDYMYAPQNYYPYNSFSNNSYNNSYYEEGGIEDDSSNQNSLNSVDYYSPFQESNNDDELVMTFLNELYDEEDTNYNTSSYTINDDSYYDNNRLNNQNSKQVSLHPTLSNSSKKETIAVRHNNPGNIKFGEFASKYGAMKGEYSKSENDGSYYAYFPSIEQGLEAQRALLKGKNYRNLTVPQALNRWAAGTYTNQRFLNMFGNKKISDLTDEELFELQKEQIKNEDINMYNKIFKGRN